VQSWSRDPSAFPRELPLAIGQHNSKLALELIDDFEVVGRHRQVALLIETERTEPVGKSICLDNLPFDAATKLLESLAAAHESNIAKDHDGSLSHGIFVAKPKHKLILALRRTLLRGFEIDEVI
jgi:hypothetical protein